MLIRIPQEIFDTLLEAYMQTIINNDESFPFVDVNLGPRTVCSKCGLTSEGYSIIRHLDWCETGKAWNLYLSLRSERDAQLFKFRWV